MLCTVCKNRFRNIFLLCSYDTVACLALVFSWDFIFFITFFTDSNNLDCDFDNGTCSWSTIRTDSTAVWTLMAGRTPSSATGPSSDHTGGK